MQFEHNNYNYLDSAITWAHNNRLYQAVKSVMSLHNKYSLLKAQYNLHYTYIHVVVSPFCCSNYTHLSHFLQSGGPSE